MGICFSGHSGSKLIEDTDGGADEYHARFSEDRVLGEGEFGVVTLVHDMRGGGERALNTIGATNESSMACKTLRKGVVFKDNTLYAPVKGEVLQREVNILRKLNGENYCLKMVAVYETSRLIYLVTEFCAGGETFQYISRQEEDLRTDDVSRIAFQLLSAVNHCEKHHVIHRDIKPENIMMVTPAPGSDLRLIDFGSGTDQVVEDVHTTFAGSAFYISPELFQRTYNEKTDVWSAGVCLYVIVAGYPANMLQRAFNMLQTNDRDLKKLPNMPDDMPDSYYDLLNELLVYRYKKRKYAGELLNQDFVQFHKNAFSVENILAEAANPGLVDGSKKSRTQSIAIRGSVGRHSLFLDYQKFERSLTTLLATLMTKKELEEFVSTAQESLKTEKNEEEESVVPPVTEHVEKKSLEIIKVSKMKEILRGKENNKQILEMIDKLPGVKMYDSFAYDTALLHYFVSADKGRRTQSGSNTARSMRLSGGSLRGSFRSASMRGSFRSKGRFSLKRSGSFSGRAGAKGPFATDNGSAGSNSRNGGKRSSVPAPVALRRAGSR
ncbi:sserine/threonine protein kinase with PASTA sensor domain [Nitzschia inconspicua]|uniref:Sserine/threonine protein kinase with PASTA sensor domain n=1 Tax=Nitzschia inconspicua TaxID=303405 RepID=A0A9K3PP24_9STRA|nr:sserine/threonine protein kinase with PASTA sensor domain [Nitzschia inconspicua]